MSRSVSFVAWLLLLLATLVAGAWGIHGLDLSRSTQAAAVAEAEDGGAVCHYTPGHLFGPPTAAEAAEARTAWYDWSQVCRYDASRGFGAWPTDAELEASRLAMGPWGTMDPTLAALWTLFASLGLAATSHGLLVGSLSIFNPAFVIVGWWLLLPDFLLAQGGWLGAASLGALAAGGLGPRYIRRREVLNALGRVPRTWLTPKRLILAGGGWLAAVGVLAAVYPTIVRLIPKASPIAAERSMPRVGNPSTVSGSRTQGGEQVAAGPVIDPVIAPPAPFSPPGSGGQTSNTSDAQQQTAQNNVAAPFAPINVATGGSGGGGGNGGEAGGGSESGSGAGPAMSETVSQPITGALQTIASYFPPAPLTPSPGPGSSTPAPEPDAGPAPSSPDDSAQPPSANPAPDRPGAPAPPVTPAPGSEGGQAIGETPIITPAYPLPSSPGTLLPETPPGATPEDPRGEPGATPGPGAPDPGATDPSTPGTEEPEATPPVQPVPEPATLGLFALGVGALTLRRKGRNKR